MKRFFPLTLILLFSGCSFNPLLVEQPPDQQATAVEKIYVVNHRWHTGFVIASQRIYRLIPSLEKRFGDIPHIEFGWGDKGFYQATEITTGLAIQALFSPSQAVIQAVAVPADVRDYFKHSDTAQLCLSDGQLQALAEFISRSFEKDENNQITTLKKGIYGNSQFYKAVGSYHLFNTCNSWTAEGLRSIGMDISSSFRLTAGSIMRFLESNSARSLGLESDKTPAKSHFCA